MVGLLDQRLIRPEPELYPPLHFHGGIQVEHDMAAQGVKVAADALQRPCHGLQRDAIGGGVLCQVGKDPRVGIKRGNT